MLAEFEQATSCSIDNALDSGEKAFRKWKITTFPQRSDVLRACSRVLLDDKAKYASLISHEMGKVLKESVAEVEKCAWVCRYYAENGARFLHDEPLNPEGRTAFISYEPIGIILAVMPWNFPFWQVFRFAAPTLMAGNAGILKHASNVPQCALTIEEIFRKSGLPEGVFQTLFAGADQVAGIIADWRVKAVTLTGSEFAGSKVAETAGRNIKKTVLELGGTDPFIVLEDADIEEAAKTGAIARMINCGQSCIAAKRFILTEAVYDDFMHLFSNTISSMKLGDPMDPKTDYGPLAREDLVTDLNNQISRSVDLGAIEVLGGNRPDRLGSFYNATVLTNVKAGMLAFDEEIFGPAASVIRVRDADEAVAVTNSSKYGLGAWLWAKDIDRGIKMARDIETGSVFINQMVASHPAIPFGGIKLSGYGRELSYLGIREFMNIKPVVY